MNRKHHHPSTFEPAEADIQKCAYYLWLEEGRPEGEDLDIWLTAKELLKHKAASHRPELALRKPVSDGARGRRHLL